MQKKKRGSSRYFVLIVFLAAVMFFGFHGLRKLFRTLDFFNIEKIEITGNRILETDFLLNISLDLIGRNMLTVSKREVIGKYENIYRIKKIVIKKRLPRKLIINFEERSAIFQVTTVSGDLFPIDGEAVFLESESYDIREALPIVNTGLNQEDVVPGSICKDEFLLNAIDLYYEIKSTDSDFFTRISQIYLEDEEIYFVELNSGFKIVLGSGDIADKIRKYNFVESNRKFEKNSIIDLRFKDKLIVRSEDE
ncbi:cell division protein FtsQ/DivIB [Candidatus Cloacimonadota bacterium]